MSEVWSNWAGNQHATPVEVIRPADADEVAAVVAGAAAAGRRVKAVGTGHSFTAIAVAPDIQLTLSQLDQVVALDRRSGLVTVEAGMPLWRLGQLLADAGMSLSNLGDIDRQTVSGALATGTHGTGARIGGLATQVRAMDLVLGDGRQVHCSPQERPALFAAARVGLGALGLVTAVTLQAEPAFRLHAQERPMALDRVLADLDELVATNEHFEFFWFPHTAKTLTKRNNRLAPGETERPLGRARRLLDDEVLGNGAFELTCRLGSRAPALIPRINEVAARLMGDRAYTASSHEVFVSPRRVRFVEMEYAVPRAAVADALRGVARVIETAQLRVSFPVEVRFSAGDDIPLSTASGRDSAYLAVHLFRGEPFERYFRGVEAVMDGLEGRPHWGKMHFQDAESLARRYPRFEEFVAVRDEVDPEGVFGNDYLDRVLGPVRSRRVG
ncbi:MAG: D-arabinono-1,4-lactone oxidase [Lapillicoccus sp.]